MLFPLVATLVASACPVPAAPAIECFTLTVPENRHKPSARTVAMPIVRFRARNPHPLAPIVLLVGGPGASSLRDKLDGANNPLVEDHDLILFPQRGTHLTKPELDCPGYRDAVGEIEKRGLHGKPAWTVTARSAADCAKQLVAAGIDLDGYDTDAIVSDLLDLVGQMKLPPVDVVSMSYGTRVILEAMRRAPRVFHAVLLDSVLPPDIRYDEVSVDNVVAALDRVLASCVLDPTCKRAYPDLRARWLAALAKTPASAPMMIEAVYDAMNDRAALPRIPKLVDALARGDLAPAKKILADNAGPGGNMRGQRLSVWCRDEAAITDVSRATKHPEFGDWETMSTPPGVCAAWPVAPAKLDTTPVVSDVPTLVVAGEYDPNTPPAWGRHIAKTLAKSFFVELPNQNHVAIADACGISILLGFYRDPSRLPDLSCVARTPPLAFEH